MSLSRTKLVLTYDTLRFIIAISSRTSTESSKYMVSLAEIQANSGNIFQRKIKLPTTKKTAGRQTDSYSAGFTVEQIQEVMRQICGETYFTIPYLFNAPCLVLGSGSRKFSPRGSIINSVGDFVLVGNEGSNHHGLLWRAESLSRWSDFTVRDMRWNLGQMVKVEEHPNVIAQLGSITDQLEKAFGKLAGPEYS